MNLRKSKTSKVMAGLIGFSMILSLFVGVGVQTASAALTQAQVDSIISLLQSFGADASTINNVRTSLTGGTPTGGGGTPSTGGFVFNNNLSLGMTHSDVLQLQLVLNADSATQVSTSGAGSPGNETNYFGTRTRAAVINFQAKYGISPQSGFVGPLTRQELNSMGGVVVLPPPPPPGTPLPPPVAGTGVTISAAAQPANSLAVINAARVPFTRFTLTAGSDGDVTVNSVTVERQGLATDGNFAGVVLLDEMGTQVGLAKTLNSNHQVILNEPLKIMRGSSKTYTVAVNMQDTNAEVNGGEIAAFAVINVNSAATVTGTLPIVGASHTLNDTLTIGTITNARGPLDPNGAQTKNVGEAGYVFASIRVTAGSQEDVQLNSVRWFQGSSSASSDLANMATVVDGTSYPTTVSSDGKYYTSVFPGGVTLTKGNSKEISVKGDIVGGSGRTITFNLEKTTDLSVVGKTYGYGITPPTSGTGFDADSIWYAGSVVTINAGTITVSNDVGVPSQNVAINLANQPLAGFTVDVKGEPVSVGSIVFNLSTIGNEAQDITNVTIVDQNGAVLAGPKDGVGTTANGGLAALTFTDSITFPVGVTKIMLKGKLGTDFVTNDTVQASTTPSSNWTTVTGQTTGTTITPSPSSSVTGSTMNVKAAAMTISQTSDPVSQTVVAGVNDFTFAKYLLNANASGEDIRLSQLLLDYSAGGTATNVKNCRLFDGATAITTGSRAVNASAAASSTTFTFDAALTVAKGTTKTLDLKCDISSGATSNYRFGITAAQTATGLTSGQSVTPTLNSSGGPLMTVAVGGTLRVTLDSSSPAYKIAAAGTTGNTVTVLRFAAENEPIRIDTVGLALNGASSSPTDLVRATLWDGPTQIGEAIFDSSTKMAGTNTFISTTTLTADFTVSKDSYKLMTVKVDTSAQGLSQPGTPGAFLAVDYSDLMRGTKGTGLSSGSTTEPSSAATTTSSGLRVFKSYPSVALATLSDIVAYAGRRDLLRFNVTASAQGDIGIGAVTFTISTTSATASADMVDNVNVYAYTDSSYATPVTGIQSDGAMAQTSIVLEGGATGELNGWRSASTQISVHANTSANASTTVLVPAGATRYFVIRGDVANLAGTSYSIATQLLGDAEFQDNGLMDSDNGSLISNGATTTYLASTTQMFGLVNEDFVWRAFSTSSTQATGRVNSAIDHANGYGIPGLPSTQTTSQILSK